MPWSAVVGRSLWRPGLVVALLTGSVRAEDASADDILDALAPRARSLSLGSPSSTMAPQRSRDSAFLDGLRDRPSYALSPEDRETLIRITAERPQIDLSIEFDRGSDVLRAAALTTARNLGRALTAERLRGQTFTIAGHTDAKGSDAMNQVLSERRADAVKRYLVTTYGIPPSTLITVGYGKAHLRNSGDPEGRENRRVQIVNMLAVQSAGR